MVDTVKSRTSKGWAMRRISTHRAENTPPLATAVAVVPKDRLFISVVAEFVSAEKSEEKGF